MRDLDEIVRAGLFFNFKYIYLKDNRHNSITTGLEGNLKRLTIDQIDLVSDKNTLFQ